MAYHNDGAEIDAASLAAPGIALRTQANDIKEEGLAPGALSHQHLPGSLGDVSAFFPSGLKAGFTRLGTAPANAFITYENWFETPAPTYYDFQLFEGSAPTPPFGAPTSPGGEGWRIPQNPGTLERPLIPTTTERLDAQGYRGVHITGSVNIGAFQDDHYEIVGGSMSSSVVDVCVLVGLGFTDGTGSRFVIEKSIRAFSHKNKIQRGPVQWFFQQSDLNVGNGEVSNFFLVTAVAGMRTYFSTGAVDAGYSIAGCQISALPCHAEAL